MNAPVRTPTVGDNVRPLVTADQLAKDFDYLEKEIAESDAIAARVPLVIEDDEDLAIANEVVPALRTLARRIDKLRDETKRPHLDASNIIQTHFKALEARPTARQAAIEGSATSFLRKKKAKADAARAEEESKQRAEAARLQAIAEAAAKTGEVEKVVVAAQAAAVAERKADEAAAPVKTSAVTRTVSPAGTAALKDDWQFDIADYAAVDVAALAKHFTQAEIDKAVRGFIKDGGRELAGVRIFNDATAKFHGKKATTT